MQSQPSLATGETGRQITTHTHTPPHTHTHTHTLTQITTHTHTIYKRINELNGVPLDVLFFSNVNKPPLLLGPLSESLRPDQSLQEGGSPAGVLPVCGAEA